MTTMRLGASHATLAGRTSMDRSAGGALLARTAEAFLTWVDRTRQRRQLAQLSDHLLRDIGISRADVEAEVTKPFWRA